MRIVCLMENTPGSVDCLAEHGLSIYIETKKHNLLVDTGATDAFLHNAEKLGIDLRKVDTVILSHGHYDHSGGVLPFAGSNPDAKIYMQKAAGEDYFSIRDTGETYIGIDKKILDLPGLVLLEGDAKIDEELSLFSHVTGRRFWAKSNLRLKRKYGDETVQDEFAHEQCLVIEQDGKHILLSGCAHNGILNILDRYREIYGREPDVVISGFHMMQKEYADSDWENIRETARELCRYQTIFYTGHCTGTKAYDVMKEIMGEQLHAIHSGEEINLNF